MANVIKHKRGSGSDPVASDLVVGEVAIRTDVGKLFTKMDNGSVAEIAGGGSDIAINTLSSSSATGGGSATFNGSAYRFTLSAPPSVSAQQLLVSINGVIQKPVAGTGQPSEGFSVDGTDIILGDAPATGSDFFILTFKSLGVSEPADNSVTSAKIANGTIVNADIADNTIRSAKILNGTLLNADINASAAIAGTKISPNFGSQTVTASNLTLSDNDPIIQFTDANNDPDYRILVESGIFRVQDTTNSNAERLTIDSSGDIGIGTSSPTLSTFGSNTGGIEISDVGSSANALLVQSGSNEFFFANTSSANYIYGADNAPLIISTNGSERMRINSSGNVGIGTTTIGNKLQVHEASSNASFAGFSNDTTGSSSSDGLIVGVDSDENGVLYHYENKAIRFATNNTERMRINSSGNVGIGTTSPESAVHFKHATENSVLRLESGDEYVHILFKDSTTTSLPYIGAQGNDLRAITGGAERMRITSSAFFVYSVHSQTTSAGANVNVQSNGNIVRSTSSVRYKKDITDATWGLTEVLKLKPKTFKNNATDEDADKKTYGGFTAEDVHDLGLTEFVEYDKDNQPDALFYGNMVALMAKAIQDLNAKVEALEAK